MPAHKFFSAAILLIFCLLFGVAGGHGVSSVGELVNSMSRHNILPIDVLTPAARGVFGAELVVCLLCGVSIFWAVLRPWAALAACVLTLTFAVYLSVVALGPEP